MIAGDVVLAYVAAGSGTEAIVAWDIESGTQLWRRNTLPGRNARGVAHRVAALKASDGWQVSVLVPWRPRAATNEWSRVEILDVRTGRSLAPEVAATGAWTYRPSVCGSDSDRFCLEGILRPETDNANDRVYEYSTAAPELAELSGTDSGYNDDGFSLTRHVSISDEGQLRYGEHGEMMWSRPYEAVFGEGSGAGGGWAWHDRSADGAPLLGMGFQQIEDLDLSSPQEIVRALDRGRTVRLDRETGRTIWSVDASICDFASDFGISVEGQIIPLCEHHAGSITLSWEGEKVAGSRHAGTDIDFVGVDVETGEVRWCVPLGSAGTLTQDQDEPDGFRARGDRHIARTDEGGLIIVDIESGATRALAEDQVVLCARPLGNVELDSIWENQIYPLAPAYGLCGPDGEVVPDALPQSATLAIAGYDTAKPVAINTADGLTLFEAHAGE